MISKTSSDDTPNVIRALTPLILAAIGGATAVIILFFNAGTTKLDPAKFTAGMAFASTTITAAAALAQPGKDQNSGKSQESQDTPDEASNPIP